ncbi:MAG: hypothetical protein QXT31_07440 [Candidatus Bathyarchaeia archaeon]
MFRRTLGRGFKIWVIAILATLVTLPIYFLSTYFLSKGLLFFSNPILALLLFITFGITMFILYLFLLGFIAGKLGMGRK